MRNFQPGAYYAGAGRRVAEADLRHISVSDHPTTDIRETCTYAREIRADQWMKSRYLKYH